MEKSLRNTKQRKHMLELLQGTKSHPNALWLYERMKPQFPNLSLSTVYRNLGILQDQGLLQRLSVGSAFDRYDATTDMHTHFYCKKCERIYDIDANNIEHDILGRITNSPHLFEGCAVTFFGICENCKHTINK